MWPGTRVTWEMVSDEGGRFIPAGIVGLHTLSILFSSLVAYDGATEDNHTTRRDPRTNANEYYSWVQYISLDMEVLTPSLCE